MGGAAGLRGGGATGSAGWASREDCLSQTFNYYFWMNGWVEEAEVCSECLKENPQANFPRGSVNYSCPKRKVKSRPHIPLCIVTLIA